MGRKKITFLQECLIVFRLTQNNSQKKVANEFGISASRVAQIKREWPLFFWRRTRIRNYYLKRRWWK